MKLLTSCILFMALLFTSTLHAARKYLQYDILNKTARTITTPANATEALAANTDDKILFVRETTQADASYYIAVFELTRAQAQNLGWTVNLGSHQYAAKAAFGEFTNTTNNNLPAPLAYPTKAQWCAYVDESPSRPCNVRYGIGNGMEAFSNEAWYQAYILTGKTACNAHGLYDTFGNVAECTIDDSTITFQGWYAETTTRFADITRETAETTLKAITDNSTKLTPSAGVRPIYLPPEEQTYSVTVLRDGEVITQQNVEPGTSITITPPTAKPNYILNAGYTVTPATITSLTFKMPMENVTFRYTSSAQATISVTGGTSNKEKIIAGESFTLTAEQDLFLEWSGPGITDENKSKNPLPLSLSVVEPAQELKYVASLKPHMQLAITNGTATKSIVIEGDIVTITATNARAFSHWSGYGITSTNKYDNPLTLTIGDITSGQKLQVTAVHKPLATIAVTNGSASPSSVYKGENLTLTAAIPSGERFSHWEGPYGITSSNETKNPLTFTLSQITKDETLTYVAHFLPRATIAVTNGSANKTTVFKNEQVTITATNERAFSHWSGYGITSTNKYDNPLTLTIGDITSGQKLQVTAVHKPLATIAVTNGSASPSSVYKGENLTLTAAIPSGERFSHWEGPYGITSSNETKNPLTFTLSQITKDETLTYVARFLPRATIAVTNGSANKTTVFKGEEVTLSAPTDGSFSYWTGPGITDSNKTQNPLTLTIETISQSGMTLAFEAKLKPAIKISVKNGSASPTRVYDGGSVTLTARGEKWQCFSAWSGGSGITDANKTTNPLTLKLSGFTADTSLTYTASFENYPRVMVYGGTVTVDKSTNNLGDGYYKVGTKLTLKPHTALPDGYVFSHWLKKDGSKVTTQNYVYTVGALGSTETFTVAYKADDSVTNTNIIYIGNVSESNLTAKTAIGYTALTTSSATYSKNTFKYYGTQEASSDYVQLDFATKKLNYTVTEEDANSEANRQTALVMKRVKPASGQPYYVGIHEVTNAQYEKVVNGKDSVAQPLLPHVTLASTRGEASTFLTKLKELFGETFVKPTKTQIETISKGAMNNTQTYGDAKITDAMVNCESDKAGLQNSGAQVIDPYGFYDLWGNAAESFQGDDTNLWGGYYGTALSFCNLNQATIGANTSAPGAIRTAITVQPRYTVKVTNLNKTFYVLKSQKITLKEQVMPGRKFLGWTVKGSTTQTYTTMPQVITVTANTTLTANFSEALTSLSLTLKNCNGPTTAFPGTTISVYPKTPGTKLTKLTVSPSTAATDVNLTEGTITFKETATGTVTVTATYQSPEAGFHFKVR